MCMLLNHSNLLAARMQEIELYESIKHKIWAYMCVCVSEWVRLSMSVSKCECEWVSEIEYERK